MDWKIGLDEAGRGSLTGPLVYGCTAVHTDLHGILEKHFIKDSKQLSHTSRGEAYRYLQGNKQYLHLSTAILQAPTIDEKMQYQSLNKISYDMVITLLVQSLRYIYKNDPAPLKIEVKLDTLSDDPETYANSYRTNVELNDITKKHFPKTKFSVEAFIGGDAIERVISAASILAKETREIEVRNLHGKYGDFGSGYPSDKRTIDWVMKNFPSPADQICRRSWKTWRNIQIKMGGANGKVH